MDILKTNWSPAWTIQSLCRAILFLLNEPNAESPLNCDAGKNVFIYMYPRYILCIFITYILNFFLGNLIRFGDIKGFKSMAKMYTKEYAM